MARLTKQRREYLRSEEAKEYRKLYDLRAWRKLRRLVLTEDPLCAMCAAIDRVTVADVVDHIVPHKGDLTLFFARENLQPLCDTCHSKHKQREEDRGWSDAFDADGYPIDPAHPANRT